MLHPKVYKLFRVNQGCAREYQSTILKRLPIGLSYNWLQHLSKNEIQNFVQKHLEIQLGLKFKKII